MMVFMASLLLAFAAGICTAGAVPNVPDTATEPFAFAGADGVEDPQPARSMMASSGKESAAVVRRMRDLVVGIMSAASLPGWGYRRPPNAGRRSARAGSAQPG